MFKLIAAKARAVVGLVLVFLFCAIGASAQTTTTPAPATNPLPTQTFSFTANAVALPGNSVTLAAAESGMTLQVTKNAQFRQDNIVAAGVQFFGAGANYFLPVISPKALNGASFHVYLTVNLGADRITTGPSPVEHWAGTAGGGFMYQLSAGGMWNFGAEFKYARLPGWANNTAVVEIGPTINF